MSIVASTLTKAAIPPARLVRQMLAARANLTRRAEWFLTHITSLLAAPVLRLARLNLPVGTLSSPTVSDRFLPRGPQHGFNATCDER
jgi:hypothetical protein